MNKTHTKIQIKKYDRYNQILMIITLFFGIFIGRHFFYEDSRNIISGIIVGSIGAIVLFLFERNVRTKFNYEKGEKLETQIVSVLKPMGYSCKQSIQTGNGDLDTLAIRGEKYFGIEAKNIFGIITYKDGMLFHNNYPFEEHLDRLLGNCKKVRNTEFGVESKIFIYPVIVFGRNVVIQDISNGEILYKNTKLKVCSINNLQTILS